MSVQPLRHTGPIEHVAVENLEDAAAVACEAVRQGAVSVGIAEDWRPSGSTRVCIAWRTGAEAAGPLRGD
jgi:hypothetical protein